MAAFEDQDNIDLVNIDDGHSPGATAEITKLALYKKKNSSNFVSIFDNVLPEEWCIKAYDYAVKRKRPWGSYISTKEAMDSKLCPDALWEKGEFDKAISLVAVRELLFNRGKAIVGSDSNIIHGTAVWCLTSDEADSVQYHIDYAELYRYETNVIYPPLYAGTCQLSPLNGEEDMKGGDFLANVRGVEHYREFGYKGKLQSADTMAKDLKRSDWVTVPYRRNRGCLHDGNYPHLSSKVEGIFRPDIKRVILGLNAFPAVVGECCARAPEHSDAFNRTIKLYQTMAGLGVPVTSAVPHDKYGNNGAGERGGSKESEQESGNKTAGGATEAVKTRLNVKDVMKNPALAKLLVTAAKKMKQKEKEEAEAALAAANEAN